MTNIGIVEFLLIAAAVVLPCLGVLIVGAILIVVVALSQKNREK